MLSLQAAYHENCSSSTPELLLLAQESLLNAGDFLDLANTNWQRTLDVNLIAVLVGIRLAADAFRKTQPKGTLNGTCICWELYGKVHVDRATVEKMSSTQGSMRMGSTLAAAARELEVAAQLAGRPGASSCHCLAQCTMQLSRNLIPMSLIEA